MYKQFGAMEAKNNFMASEKQNKKKVFLQPINQSRKYLANNNP